MAKQSRGRRQPGKKPPIKPFPGTPGSVATLAQVARQRLTIQARAHSDDGGASQMPRATPVWVVDVDCSCGARFRMEPPIPQGDEAALTGGWVLGACPTCKRGHQLRITVVARVDEETAAHYAARLAKDRGTPSQ